MIHHLSNATSQYWTPCGLYATFCFFSSFFFFFHLFSKNDFASEMVSANFAACQFQHPVLCSREKNNPKKVVKKIFGMR